MNKSIFLLSLILVFLIGALVGIKYKDWHYLKIGTPVTEVSPENFDNAIKLLYVEGYCKGFPIKTGIYADERTDKAYSYKHCGLPFRMVLTPEEEYMFFIDEKNAIPVGIVRYE